MESTHPNPNGASQGDQENRDAAESAASPIPIANTVDPKSTGAQGGRLRQLFARLAAVGKSPTEIAALIAIITAVGTSVAWGINKYNSPRASFEEPRANQELVGRPHLVRGVAKNIPPDSVLWLVLRSDEDGSYYPLDRITVDGEDWRVAAQLGPKCLTAPKNFELLVFDTDSAGNAEFERTRAAAATNGDNLKLDELPDRTMKPLARLPLQRLEDQPAPPGGHDEDCSGR